MTQGYNHLPISQDFREMPGERRGIIALPTINFVVLASLIDRGN